MSCGQKNYELVSLTFLVISILGIYIIQVSQVASGPRFLRHSQIFEQLFVLINTKEALWNIQALQYP